jgi:hypothetical protein
MKKSTSHISSTNSRLESISPRLSIHLTIRWSQRKTVSSITIDLTLDLYRFQYFLSVVPTVYIADDFGRKIIETNQYAVTEQSHPAAGSMGQEVPGRSHPDDANRRNILQI